MDRREFLAAAGTVAAAATASQAFAQTGEAPDMHPPKYKALEESRFPLRRDWQRLPPALPRHVYDEGYEHGRVAPTRPISSSSLAARCKRSPQLIHNIWAL